MGKVEVLKEEVKTMNWGIVGLAKVRRKTEMFYIIKSSSRQYRRHWLYKRIKQNMKISNGISKRVAYITVKILAECNDDVTEAFYEGIIEKDSCRSH